MSPDAAGEELLEQLLSGGEPEGAQDLTAFIAECRADAGREDAEASLRAEAVRRRVLARTTREDLGWRGDLRLWGDHFKERWHSSHLVQFVAASLLLHVLALPVLAVYHWTRPEPLPLIYVEPPVEPAYGPDPVEPEPLSDEEDEAGIDALYVENSINWARYRSTTVRVELPAPDPASVSELEALLRARCEVLGSGLEYDATRDYPWEQAAGLAAGPAATLTLEAYLDLRLRSERSRPLARELTRHVASTALGEPGPDAVLAASALARAEAYGLLAEDDQRALEEARERLAGSPGYLGLVRRDGAFRRASPLSPEWVSVLRESSAAAELDEALLDALAGR